jgi:hypothetical protein
MHRLVDPTVAGTRDFGIASRVRGSRESGSMNGQQLLAGKLAGFWLASFMVFATPTCVPFAPSGVTSLGDWICAKRAMAGTWRCRCAMRILEVSVDHRRRAGGHSKVSGHGRGASLRERVFLQR